MLGDIRPNVREANFQQSRVSIYFSIRYPAQEILPQLITVVDRSAPLLLLWSDTSRWSPRVLMTAATWGGIQGTAGMPVTIVTHWAAWSFDRTRTIEIVDVRRRMPVPLRWIWAVPRTEWANARMMLQAIAGGLLPDDDRLDPDFSGWVEQG